MANPDYDKTKFTMDEYGNLYPKDKIKCVKCSKYFSKRKGFDDELCEKCWND